MSRFDDAFRSVASESLGKATIAFDWVEDHKVETAAIVIGTAAMAVGGRMALRTLMRSGSEPWPATEALTAAELNLASRGFQLPRHVPVSHGPPGPTFINRLSADTVEGSLLSRVQPAAKFGYPEDSFITLDGHRKSARVTLHLADGTKISHSPGLVGVHPWRAILPDGSVLHKEFGTVRFGRAKPNSIELGPTIAQDGQLTLPKTLEEVRLREELIPKFMELRERYPIVSTTRHLSAHPTRRFFY